MITFVKVNAGRYSIHAAFGIYDFPYSHIHVSSILSIKTTIFQLRLKLENYKKTWPLPTEISGFSWYFFPLQVRCWRGTKGASAGNRLGARTLVTGALEMVMFYTYTIHVWYIYLYLPTFGWFLWWMLVNIPYMVWDRIIVLEHKYEMSIWYIHSWNMIKHRSFQLYSTRRWWWYVHHWDMQMKKNHWKATSWDCAPPGMYQLVKDWTNRHSWLICWWDVVEANSTVEMSRRMELLKLSMYIYL